MREEVTPVIAACRENARHLWNSFFMGLPRAVTFDDMDCMDEVCRKLLCAAIDVEEEGYVRPPWHPIPLLQIEPLEEETVIPAAVQREPGAHCGYFDHAVEELGFPGTQLVFIEFFDFDVLRMREFEYVRVRITECAEHPEIVGHDALLEVGHCRFVMDRPESA